MTPLVTRRRFVAGLTAAALLTEQAVARAPRRIAPSDRVNLAAIGAGGKGAENMAALTGQNILALADVDFDHVASTMAKLPAGAAREALAAAYAKAVRYADYRAMLDARRDLDAVVIATPDHHHAQAAKLAMERGLHVFVQKPLTATIHEARLLTDLARANPRLVTQMGNQGHSGDDGRRAVELLRGGAIGRVREVHAWTNRPIWPQGVPRPAPGPTPASLDWPLWLGPAPVDWGYNPAYAHFNWRGWVPFGIGALGDMGAHLIDFPLWALAPGTPSRIEARHTPWGGDANPFDGKPPAELGSYPLATVVRYEFDRAPGGPLTLTWYDGALMPPTPRGWPANVRLEPNGGVLYLGEGGMLAHETYGERPVLVGDGTAERAAAIPQSLPRIQGGRAGHEQNWIRAIGGQEAISSPFAVAAPLTETMLLGLAALRAEQPLELDATGRIANFAGADALLTREYRKGWEL